VTARISSYYVEKVKIIHTKNLCFENEKNFEPLCNIKIVHVSVSVDRNVMTA
jgi:hypothetical protein